MLKINNDYIIIGNNIAGYANDCIYFNASDFMTDRFKEMIA